MKVSKSAEKSCVFVSVEEMASRLVEAEIREGRVKRPHAQKNVATRAGLKPTAIESLLRGRLVHIERISAAIKDAYAAFLEKQIVRLETELAFARARDRERDFSSVEASIASAKASLSGADQ